MLACVNTIAMEGVKAVPVEVEVDLSRGLPSLSVVGLADEAVREAKDRIRAALKNSGYKLPTLHITINLAPAHLPKVGSAYDLPMALGLLAAMEQLPLAALSRRLFLGELALDGRLKSITGALPAAIYARNVGIEEIIVPEANGLEAAFVEGVRVVAPANLLALVRHLLGVEPLSPLPVTDWQQWMQEERRPYRNLREVKGQEYARRALEVVAAGGHNLLMSGPPGSGKTLLAQCLPGILPPITLDEALEVTTVHSVAGRLDPLRPFVGVRPFRAPHHTASQVALIGGGGHPRPGEVSLAHRGVLFLDEIPEFGRTALEVLREPLESGDVHISRAAMSTRFPASFQLVAACNPCPCGYFGSTQRSCRCTQLRIEQYRSRLSGPLLDRIDLHVEVPAVPQEVLVAIPQGESSEEVALRVIEARQRQFFRNGIGVCNARLDGLALEHHAGLGEEERALLLKAAQRLGFSARSYNRILKVARTVADLAGAERILSAHLSEAIQYRIGGLFSHD
ncbi:MAG: YifB family Mg chelatase-like AAA ATPase [Magnetococcales bacterium]|nr:YifB family Mg chelatase-like AAA ATPase [Magnetococcales bacterium]